LAAERRGEMDLRFAKWQVSWNSGKMGTRRIGANKGGIQNGKQGEMKSVAQANDAAVHEGAGSS